ncbi:MAG: hypothetical protein U0694_05535 [Anaerolineae bacterium]
MSPDPNEKITVEVAQRILGTASVNAVRKVVAARWSAAILPMACRKLTTPSIQAAIRASLGRQVVEHLRAVLLSQTATPDIIAASQDERALYAEQAAKLPRHTLLRAIRAFNDAVSNYRGGWQPQLALELALVESLRGGSDDAGHSASVPSYAAPAPADIAALVRQMVGEQLSRASGETPREVPAPPVEVPANPGAPPVIAIEAVRDNWGVMLKALFQLNSQAPAVAQHLTPVRVDGNVLTVATGNATHFGLFQSGEYAAGRIRLIENALERVHGVVLKLKVILAENQEQAGTAPKTIDDPLVRFGIEELGGVIRDDE